MAKSSEGTQSDLGCAPAGVFTAVEVALLVSALGLKRASIVRARNACVPGTRLHEVHSLDLADLDKLIARF